DKVCNATSICSHFCRRTPGGPVCSCKEGYKLENNRTCVDINECNIYGLCDQHCLNKNGSYQCQCEHGYQLQDDNTTCKAEGGEAIVVFSSKTEIDGLYLGSKIHVPMTVNLKHVVGVSLDSTYIYWSDIKYGNEAIFRSLIDGDKREVIVTCGLGLPEDIAVDWVTENLYFTDSQYKHIGVCNEGGTYCTVIVKEMVDKPRGIVLVPSAGRMYWSDWGENPHIATAGMDGQERTVFVYENMQWPNGLAIDYPNERLYWVDAKLQIIESIRLDGKDRRVVLKDVARHPFAIAIFENRLYWSDWYSNSIQSCDKFTGKNLQILFRRRNEIYGIHIYHSVLKPEIPNPCNNKPCSQICLLAPNSRYTCACTLDMELSSNQHTCKVISKKRYVVIAAGNVLLRYYHEILGRPKVVQSEILKHTTALAYDSLDGTVLAADSITHSVFQIDLAGATIKNKININNALNGDMDFDYFGNNLYWCDAEKKAIEVHSLQTRAKTVFHYQEEPRNILVIPELGIMYVVFFSNDNLHIDKLAMNGNGTQIRVIDGYDLLGPKVAFAYDRELERVYWADQGSGHIESMNANGKDRRNAQKNLKEPVSIAILGNDLFWTLRKSSQLFWAPKNGSDQKAVTLNVPENIERMHLTNIYGIYANPQHTCRLNNGGCSHVCLVVTSNTHVCACPPGLILSENERTCKSQVACTSDQINCKSGSICIDKKQRCNGILDCPDGEDEINCGHALHCGENEFMCKNGECINMKKRCNSIFDCKDRSDEETCNLNPCKPGEFRCRKGNCILKYNVCDGKNDCDDFSDELDCKSNTCDTSSFRCDSGKCIPKDWKCDGQVNELQNSPSFLCNGIQDCPMNDDEYRCYECERGEFMCENKRCIQRSWVCDKFDDCGDKSDEINCDNNDNVNLANNASTSCEGFRCTSGFCISYKNVCDGVRDCSDGSDEGGKCESSCTAINPCPSICQKTPSGPICTCEEGYRLEPDGVSCKDINECEEDACPQICRNKIGSFSCSCYEGYVLREDEISCKVAGPPMEIITATKEDIRKIPTSLSSIRVLYLEPNVGITGLDVNTQLNSVYWSNELLGTISKLTINTRDRQVAMNVGKPEVLAVDWVTDNVYFYDSMHPHSLKICHLEEQKCAKVVAVEGSAKVMSITLDPKHGWLFWSQTNWRALNDPSSEIYRSDMTGSNLKPIVDKNIGVISGMTVDHQRSRLYWADAHLNVIERADLDGANREIFLKSQVHHPIGINLYEDSLYWLVSNSGRLKTCSLHGMKICQTVQIGSTNIDQFFTLLQTSRQPSIANKCHQHKCDNICVPRDDNSVCICQNGHILKENATCTESLITAINFVSTKQELKSQNIRQVSGMFTGIIVTATMGIIMLTIYYYYVKKKFSMLGKRNVSIHFQNPSFGRRQQTRNECIAPVLSQSHNEYSNPLSELPPRILTQGLGQKKVIEVENSDHSESEMEDTDHSHKTHLIC
ncbi:vitellogenin receptor, partial [Orussus abietinus]|uniref:vitellogenin receptor n=1 Tax=Orussus abietinus TaxID=222816 RepID=UPI000C715C10